MTTRVLVLTGTGGLAAAALTERLRALDYAPGTEFVVVDRDALAHHPLTPDGLRELLEAESILLVDPDAVAALSGADPDAEVPGIALVPRGDRDEGRLAQATVDLLGDDVLRLGPTLRRSLAAGPEECRLPAIYREPRVRDWEQRNRRRSRRGRR